MFFYTFCSHHFESFFFFYVFYTLICEWNVIILRGKYGKGTSSLYLCDYYFFLNEYYFHVNYFCFCFISVYNIQPWDKKGQRWEKNFSGLNFMVGFCYLKNSFLLTINEWKYHRMYTLYHQHIIQFVAYQVLHYSACIKTNIHWKEFLCSQFCGLRGLFYAFFIVCWFYVKKYNQKLKFSSRFKSDYLNLFFFWIKSFRWSFRQPFKKSNFTRWNWIYFLKVCSWHFFYPCFKKKIIPAEILRSKSTKVLSVTTSFILRSHVALQRMKELLDIPFSSSIAGNRSLAKKLSFRILFSSFLNENGARMSENVWNFQLTFYLSLLFKSMSRMKESLRSRESSQIFCVGTICDKFPSNSRFSGMNSRIFWKMSHHTRTNPK